MYNWRVSVGREWSYIMSKYRSGSYCLAAAAAGDGATE